jgi:signal transduction histidine kinase
MVLKRLRFQLTVLYLLVSMSLVALTGAGAYLLLQRYLQVAADQALEYKMAVQFEQYGLALPPELAQAEQNWLKQNSHDSTDPTSPPAAILKPALPTLIPSSTSYASATPQASPTLEFTPSLVITPSPGAELQPPIGDAGIPKLIQVSANKDDGESGDGSTENEDTPSSQNSSSDQRNLPTTATTPVATTTPSLGVLPRIPREETYEDDLDARLAPIFITPLNNSGKIESTTPANQSPSVIPIPPIIDSQAAAAALKNGVDWRTIVLAGGSQLRLLTYRTGSATGPALLQAGRLLDDQVSLLKSFLTGILILSGLSVIFLGLASWWLSGRSLGPAEKAWDQQQAFISNASHELRTPLTLIQATTEVALRSQPDPVQKEYLANIHDEIQYMNHMVDDLLLLARRDARRLKLSREAIILTDLFIEIQRQIESLAARQGVSLRLGDRAGTVWADKARLRQILLILLDNAIRYTPHGATISLEAAQSGRICKIMVSDNGAGIPPEHLPHIFERFYQAPASSGNETHNHGLGLSIAKALVEAMNGQITIESQPGKGTRVILELPSAGSQA